MYTWEIKNWLKANNNTFMSAKLFFDMIDSSPQINYIKLCRVWDTQFEMAIASNDGLQEVVLVIKNI
jgi:hypothetical protein